MSQYYTIQITGGTSEGLYTIYYNSIGAGYIPNIYNTITTASNLTLTELLAGVTVDVPTNTTKLFLVNTGQNCGNYQEFEVTPTPPTYPCICIHILSVSDSVDTQFQVCYDGNTINGKPHYTGSTVDVTWNTNGYWNLNGFTNNGVSFRSGDFDNVPDSNWYGVGNGSQNYSVTTVIGDCPSVYLRKTNLNITTNNPTCGGSDGSIIARGVGDLGWTYSIDGLSYDNLTGIFVGLPASTYVIYAKNSNGDIVSQTVTLNLTPTTSFVIPAAFSLTPASSSGNMQVYYYTVSYDTSNIPVGETVTFDYILNYSPQYSQPGNVIFDYNSRSLSKNGGPSLSWSNSIPYSESILPLPCDTTLNSYVISDQYKVTHVSLVNGDTLELSLFLGVDTQTNGGFSNNCLTQGLINVQTTTDNRRATCQCCSFEVTSTNQSTPQQFYKPQKYRPIG